MIRPLRAIVLDATIAASPADVWQALTDAELLANWFAPFITAQQGLGGIVEMSWDRTNKWPTTIDVWDPDRQLRWADPPATATDAVPQPRLMVDWIISSEAGQTVLRLVHSGFGEGANWDAQIDGTLGGWKYFLWNLEVCLTKHRGTPRTMVSSRRRSQVTRDALWPSLFSSGFITMDHTAAGQNECTLTLGEKSFAGLVETNDPRYRFAARFPSLNDALLFIELEGGAAHGFHAGFWLSTYGVAPQLTAELRTALDDTVARLVDPAVPAAL